MFSDKTDRPINQLSFFWERALNFTVILTFPLALISVFYENLSYFALFTALICISFCDAYTLQVPNLFQFIVLTAGLPALIYTNKNLSISILFAAFILLCGFIINRRRSLLGGADIKIMSLLCIITGPARCLYIFIAANFFAIIPSIFAMILKKIIKARNTCEKIQVPFVPFITLGFILSFFRL
jgi:Flp pilus assembly protein protease CpaA